MKNILEYKRVLTVAGAGLMAFSGACWGYILAHRELEEQFNRDLEHVLGEEVKKIQTHYALRYKDTGPEAYSELKPEDIVVDQKHIVIDKEFLSTPEGRQAVLEAVRQEVESQTDETEDAVEQNAFEAEDQYVEPEYNFEQLMADRSADVPFVISKDEFYRNEAKFNSEDLTFFEGDGVLIDEDEQVIPDEEQVVGLKNLQMFGVMSEDNRVVYIQNDRIETIFRVQRNPMSAAQALYGQDPEEEIIQHSSMKRRRPRGDDE